MLLAGPGKVEFKDVQFRYVPEHNVLQGLSITLQPGCVTALIGPSGAGKTTAVDLLMRLYEPNGGLILIDGQPVSSLDPSAVRREIGVVSADGTVFRGTLADNIRYKRPEATDEEVASATLEAGLGPALDRLPDGLNTEVGEHGVGLSAGERQRLQIARMLVANPRILVFDEATANLDYATESDVKETLNRKLKGKTILVIAHRYSMVKDADYVYVLDRGKIVEQGNPTDLILAGGWFAQLAQASEGGSEHEVKTTGDVIIDYESAGSSEIEDEEDNGEEESDGDA
jgi:ABC-type multidrug transport system fused ATPase/permease subunit